MLDTLRAHLRALGLLLDRDPRRRAARAVAAQGRDREGGLPPAPAAGRPREDADGAPAGPALRPHGAARPLRARERRPAAVPVPPVPDPEGVAGGAAAGGALPGVHPGRRRRRSGNGELPFHYEVELPLVMADALAALPDRLPPFTHPGEQPQGRRGLLPGPRPDGRRPASLRAVDKLDKVGPDARRASCSSRTPGPTDAQAQACLALAAIRTTDASFADRVRALGVEHELLDEGLLELGAGRRGGRASTPPGSWWPTCASPAAWTTTRAPCTRRSSTGYERPRLDLLRRPVRRPRLATAARRYPGVGLSIGVSRLVAAARRTRPGGGDPVGADVRARRRARREAPAGLRPDRGPLRRRGIPSRSRPSAAKYGKQIRHADRRGIPFVWFPGDEDGAATRSRTSGRATRPTRTPTAGSRPSRTGGRGWCRG